MNNNDVVKISELTGATAITSSDILPIVQNGVTKKMNILDMIYPVGSIYISILDTNPSVLFGGNWQAFGQGRTLVGLNGQDEDFDTLLKAGGEKTHTLTLNEMPEHIGHLTSNSSQPTGGTAAGIYVGDNATSVSGDFARGWNDLGHEYYPAGVSRGGSQAHNILQPYIVVSMWLRVG